MKQLQDLNSLQTHRLLNELKISITHNSSAIEGISLNEGETKKLIETGTTAPNKPMYDHLMILGFAECFDYIKDTAFLSTNVKITSELIKDIHQILFSKALSVTPTNVPRPVGAYRTDERKIQGVDIKLTAPNQISNELENLFFQYHKQHKITIKEIADFHIKFEKIHPFSDGNGRIGRLLITFQALQNNIIPPLIIDQKRKEYLYSLNNLDNHIEFLISSIEETQKIINAIKSDSNRGIRR